MSNFAIPIPDRLPIKISPCPIIEAVLEIRFITSAGWTLIPGLLFPKIRDKYGRPEPLPLSNLPDEIRKSEPRFSHKPLSKFVGKEFEIHLGPRVISLRSNENYPGWNRVRNEIEWLISQIESADFVDEGERLGMRYIDFFEGDLFQNLVIETNCAGVPMTGTEMNLTTVFNREDFLSRLTLNNSVFVETKGEARTGSILDLDVSLSASKFDLFENGLDKFDDAHRLNKEVFFGLLKEEFLQTLNPEFEERS
ncbi:MAG: hypothetical protein CMO55_28975 [Verrucomicrobiales bacterium]|nr:hypothetical protein [Verrucomicrobiales bacterium]